MHQYVWLIPLFPVLGVLINGLLGHKLPKKVIGPIACIAVGLSAILSTLIFFEVKALPPESRILNDVISYTWMAAGNFTVDIGFLVDPLSLVMLLVVCWVSLLIHIYSIGYMHGDPGYARFFTELNLFVFFMLILVSANNFLMMFVGWEGVGLCSYLLIGFWYEKKSATDAGNKAFIVNRIGDFGFLLGIFGIFFFTGTLNFQEVFAKAPATFAYGGLEITLITLALFLGATGKSAQVPLYTWLPDAMEGPTPVSALIHAATMVTAGVYMVARMNVLFMMAPISLMIVGIIGAITAIYAATIGMTQFDIKRVLAYSTVSQLGYMFLACGVGAFSIGIFHLMTHAFFKALLFMAAGSVMHALAGELDMRKMGDLRKHMPHTYRTFLIGTLAIAGIPPLAGFFSKDEILYKAFSAESTVWEMGGVTLWAIGLTAALITAFYMFRAVFMTFHGKSRVDDHVAKHLHESPAVMTTPLWILAILSIIGGWVGIPWIESLNLFPQWLEPVMKGKVVVSQLTGGIPAHAVHHSLSFELMLALVSVVVAAIGIFIAYKLYVKNPELPERLTYGRFFPVYHLVLDKYRIDELYDRLFVKPTLWLSEKLMWRVVDEKIIDGTVNGIADLAKGWGSWTRRLQTGYVQNYALMIVIGVVLIFSFIIYLN
jgi:NADH-quinone oxidoreductase subunit L